MERFELERFEWDAPDRLEVVGRFYGLRDAQFDAPVLVVSGDGDPHRLSAAPETDPPADGEPWSAQFVWHETPVGVDAATLELGPDLVVELPAPGARQTLLRPRFLDVQRTAPLIGDVTLQAELVASEQHVREVSAALERAEAELARARADVEAERHGREADAEQFREGLARVRESAEEALAELRDQVEAAQSARAQAESELDALREQVAASDGLKRRIAAVEEIEAGEMRDDAQRLLERLTRLVDALDAGK